MLKQGTFVSKKYNSLVFGNVWGRLACCINPMIDSFISGNQLGGVSLQAVSIVFPLFFVISFSSYLIGPGSAIIFGKCIGQFKQKEAYRAAGVGLISSVLIGFIFAAILWLIKEPFLAYYGCTGELYQEASAYYNWIIPFTLLRPIDNLLFSLDIADGESVLTSFSCCFEFTANIILSVILSKIYGIAGLGMANCISSFIACLCYCLHYFKKSNNVKYQFAIDYKLFKKFIVLSFSSYMTYFFIAIVDIIMDKYIIKYCGMEYLPAYSVVNLIFGICFLYASLHNAGACFISCYSGEKNNLGMDIILRKMTRSTLIMSAGITLVFFFGAPLMPILYGLKTPVMVESATLTSRIMSFTALGFGACFLSSEISCYIEKPGQACFISFLYNVFTPLLLSIPLGFLWGFTGVAIGMSLSTFLAFGIYALIYIPIKGKKGFPIFVKDYGLEVYSYDLCITLESIIELRDKVLKEMTTHGYKISYIKLLIEELYVRIMEKNPDKKILSECTLLFDKDNARIIIRDNGVIFNFVDENNYIESLNAHVLNCLLEQTENKNYILTASFNRNGFVFKK